MKKNLLLGFFLALCLSLFNKANAQQDTVGVVLMGGGALGFAHVGVLDYLEELRVPIDRIGGTSMGGIAGGFYALGYSAQELTKLIQEQDWDNALSNDYNWDVVPLHIIDTKFRYLLSLQKSGETLGFDSAIINGINIYNLIQEYTYPVAYNMDFEDLALPFFCVSVDLMSGKEVILDKGYLPDALRSTMSIPAVFNPMKLDSMLLVDGAVLNNFPINIMREKGANKVIGVRLLTTDSTASSYRGPIEVLGRTFDIISQTARVGFEGDCDICIDVPLQGYGMTDFGEADSLIAIGRRAAEQYEDVLRPLASQNGFREKPARQFPSRSSDTLTLWQINITGNNNFARQDIRKIMKLKAGDPVTFSDIKLAIQRLQASDLFRQLYYNFLFEEEGMVLNVAVEEKSNFSLNVGLRYDSDFGISFLLNPEVKNWRGFGSLLQTEMRINANPYFKASFIGQTNKLFSPFASIQVSSDRYFEFVSNDEQSQKQLNQVQAQLGLQIQPTIKTVFGLGLEWQWFGFTEKLTRTIFENLNEDLVNYYAHWETNLLNDHYYPTKGIRGRAMYKFITKNFSDFDGESGRHWLSADLEQYLPLGKKLTLGFSGQLGYGSDVVDEQYLFYQGGMNRHLRLNSMVQPGMNLMRERNLNILALQGLLRITPSHFQHYWLGYGVSSLSEDFMDLDNQAFAQGIFIGAGYNSFLGPLELWLSSPVDELKVSLFLKAGFRF